MRGIKAGVATAVLATTPPGAPRLQNSSLISKLLPNFAQFDDALRSQGLGGSPHTASLGLRSEVCFLPLASPSWIRPQCQVSEGPFGGNDPVWEGVGATEE